MGSAWVFAAIKENTKEGFKIKVQVKILEGVVAATTGSFLWKKHEFRGYYRPNFGPITDLVQTYFVDRFGKHFIFVCWRDYLALVGWLY